jgi:tRNA (guanine-N7-)-methyltransferase
MTDRTAPHGAPWRNFYGRRRGKGLRDTQRTYLDEDLDRLSPGPVSWAENPERHPLDLDAVFGGREVWVEIGFGGGEHMVHQAGQHPEAGIIGCEPFINGVAMLLARIREAGVTNLAVYPGDARDLFDVLPDASVSRAFLLYPDPWPKARHHRRRFVTPEHLAPLARVLKPGPSSAWRPTFPTMSARRSRKCRRPGSPGRRRVPTTGATPGRTGCRPATSRRPSARGAVRTT